MPGHGRSKFGLLCIVPLWFLPCTLGAVIEVTAGGVVSDPTYRFSDASGMELATLIGNATALIASGDVVTGDGNSISAMANKIAALQTQVDALQTIISTTAYVGARLYPTHNAQQTFTNQVGAVVTLDLVELSSGTNVVTTNSRFEPVGTAAAGYFSCTGSIGALTMGSSILQYVSLNKNNAGAIAALGVQSGATTESRTISTTSLTYLNGAGDYVSLNLYVRDSSGGTATVTVTKQSQLTFLSCHRVGV